nr:hypothetical protein [uncultured Albidiferax sp.]
MHSFQRPLVSALLALLLHFSTCYAQDTSQLAKYGGIARNAEQREADEEFLKSVDFDFPGDRKKASEEFVKWGWDYIRQRDLVSAMRRFNQAWLLDSTSGTALWGMASVLGLKGEHAAAVALYGEADLTQSSNKNFSADYAMTLGVSGKLLRDPSLVQKSYARFAKTFERDSQHVGNLHNWAMTLYYNEAYSEAWDKVKLAESIPIGKSFDPKFIEALTAKMPRP